MAALDDVLERLARHKLRPNGNGRWRACCPAHGGANPTALSIGVGDDGRVLLKCWHGCGVDDVVDALGLDVANLFPPRPRAGSGSPPIERRHLITAGQALDVLEEEIHLAVVVASSLAQGKPLDAPTRERLLRAAARVILLREEVHA